MQPVRKSLFLQSHVFGMMKSISNPLNSRNGSCSVCTGIILRVILIERNFYCLDFEGMIDNASDAGDKSDKQQITELLALLSAKNQLLEQAASDMETLKTKFREIFEEKSDTGVTEAGKTAKATSINCVGSVPLQQDEGYFQTYSHYGIHHDMLSVSFS